jgi:hypothetical protein
LPITDLRQKINKGRDARNVTTEARCWERGDDFCDIGDSDRFLAFTRNITTCDYPREFKLVGITKYFGKQDPW